MPTSTGQPTLHNVASIPSLTAAWERVLANSAVMGNPTRGVVKFKRDFRGNLEQLSHELNSGTFTAGGLSQFTLKVQGKKNRVLAIPPVRTRVVERAIVTALQPELDLNLSSLSFAYRPSSSVHQAVRAVLELRDEGATHALVADIADCFPSIDIRRLEGRISDLVECNDIRVLIGQLLHRQIPGQLTPALGLPQGSPLSPLLCNLFLDELDTSLMNNGIRAVRYADDLVIPSKSARAAEKSLVILERGAQELGLSLSIAKTNIMSFTQGFAFLGEHIDSTTPQPKPELTIAGKSTLYLGKPGARAAVSRGRVRVVANDEELLSAPQTQVGRIVTFGPVGVSAGLRQWALNSEVDIVLLSARGKFLGSLTASGTATVHRRMRQYEIVGDTGFATTLASRFVRGKIANSRSLLQRYLEPQSAVAVNLALGRMKSNSDSAAAAQSVGSVRGFEGAAANAYWTAFQALLPLDSGFEGRRRRPPRDPANAALSLGYTLLAGEAVGALAGVGLDPAAGFLHSERDGRASLAYDLIEEFRPLVVDTLVLEMLRRGMLAGDFMVQNGSVRFGEKSRTALFRRFENRMLTMFSCAPARTRCSYRRALHVQAQRIATCIELGDATRYWPVTWRA